MLDRLPSIHHQTSACQTPSRVSASWRRLRGITCTNGMPAPGLLHPCYSPEANDATMQRVAMPEAHSHMQLLKRAYVRLPRLTPTHSIRPLAAKVSSECQSYNAYTSYLPNKRHAADHTGPCAHTIHRPQPQLQSGFSKIQESLKSAKKQNLSTSPRHPSRPELFQCPRHTVDER